MLSFQLIQSTIKNYYFNVFIQLTIVNVLYNGNIKTKIGKKKRIRRQACRQAGR
jgi:hypothetical protein